jgi:hypothetical protein
MKFAPFNGAFEGHLNLLEKAGLDVTQNLWYKVYDFTCHNNDKFNSNINVTTITSSTTSTNSSIGITQEAPKEEMGHNWEIIQQQEKEDGIWYPLRELHPPQEGAEAGTTSSWVTTSCCIPRVDPPCHQENSNSIQPMEAVNRNSSIVDENTFKALPPPRSARRSTLSTTISSYITWTYLRIHKCSKLVVVHIQSATSQLWNWTVSSVISVLSPRIQAKPKNFNK